MEFNHDDKYKKYVIDVLVIEAMIFAELHHLVYDAEIIPVGRNGVPTSAHKVYVNEDILHLTKQESRFIFERKGWSYHRASQVFHKAREVAKWAPSERVPRRGGQTAIAFAKWVRRAKHYAASLSAPVSFIAISLLITRVGLSPFRLSFTADRWLHLLVGYSTPDSSLLLFVPFGIAGFACLRASLSRAKASVVALLSSASLALAIETLQAFEPGQISSITDAVLASLCGAIGVIAAQLLDSRLESQQTK
jgi:hypothetical protein